MSLFALVAAELRHRKVSAALFAVAVAVAVTLALLLAAFARAGADETRRLQRDAGLNLVILPADLALDRYWTLGWSDRTLPAAYLDRIQDQDVANRLVPMLRRKIEWDGDEVRVTGIRGETFKRDLAMKPVFGRVVEPGTVVLGGAIARARGLAAGDEARLGAGTFTVARVLAEKGSPEDADVFLDLADAQRLLGLEGRLSEIQALECHCALDDVDATARLVAGLEGLLPDTQVVRRERLADARRGQRRLAERYLGFATGTVALLCGLWIATLAMLNVRERRAEIAVLRALGRGARDVAAIVLGRALVLGAAGALLGWAAAALLAWSQGPVIFRVASGAGALDLDLALAALVLAPLFAVVASLAPAAVAATQDPAVGLSDA